MCFDSMLISCFLLVPVVLGQGQSRHLNMARPSDVVRNPNKAGAIWEKDNGAFNYVMGSFIVPQLSGDPGSAIAIWVAIDGDGCQMTMGALSSGIVSTVTSNGIQHQGFLSWVPNSPIDFDITISTGDRIQVTLNIFDLSTGSLFLNNLSNGQSVTKTFQTSSALCGWEAEWMVGTAKTTNGQEMSLAYSDSVFITGAAAGTRGGSSYEPFGAYLHELYTGHTRLTNTTAYSDSSLNVTWLQQWKGRCWS